MEDNSANFNIFIALLQQVSVNQEVLPVEAFSPDNVKFGLIRLMRNLRGIAMGQQSTDI
jgi:exportin-7